MSHANVLAVGKTKPARLDTRSDPLLALDAEALAEVWAVACDDEGVNYSTLCSSRERTLAPSDAEE